MELPQPPADQELKNIIDKLAQFVARNGPEFEHMTKQKQKDNPKFSFLFGGSYFHYYQYRVTTEQAILKQKQRSLEQQALVQQVINRQSIQSTPWQQPHLIPPIQDAQEQIRQSEQNLAAQHQLLLQQQQVQVDDTIRKAQDEKLNKMAKDSELDLKELDGVLQPIIDSCTKDSISSGKGWIFNHATNFHRSEVIAMYILKKVTEPGATFETKLHLVYLINDVLHHCIRKNADDLKKILDRVVVPIFCSTSIGIDSEKQQKLSKLHKLWETNKYFAQPILDQLRNPATSLATYQAGLIAEYAALITPITTAIQTQYTMLQKQHQDFVAHLTGQMHHIQSLPFAFQPPPNTMLPSHQPLGAPFPMPPNYPPQVPFEQHNQPPPEVPNIRQPPPIPQDPRLQQQLVPEEAQPVSMEPPAIPRPEITQSSEEKSQVIQQEGDNQPNNEQAAQTNSNETEKDKSSDASELPSTTSSGPQMQEYPQPEIRDRESRFGQNEIPGRRQNGRPAGRFDDFSPHYGHPASANFMIEPAEFGMTPPHAPYDHPMHFREMAPMGNRNDADAIDLMKSGYIISNTSKGMNPHDIAPIPPDFVEPSVPPGPPPYYDLPAGLMVPLVKLEDTDYDNPLDPEDIRLPPPALPTERLLAAVEQFYCPPTHERTRNNSYVISSEGWEQLGLYEFFKAKNLAKKQKGMPEENREYSLTMDMPPMPDYVDNQPHRRRYREFKSPEPESAPEKNSKEKRRSRSISRSRSRSPERIQRASRSPSPPRPHFQRSRGRSRSRTPDNKRRSPDRSPSPTPPSFSGGSSKSRDRRLDESNKGHQLLKKMGWSGAGLGAAEQGIQDPVDAGDVRDRQDMYKGIGSNLNDPYENFRKSKGQAFINRMKARAEELGKM